jgi:hypothetical protein
MRSEAAVSCAVNPVHGSTVDHTEGVSPLTSWTPWIINPTVQDLREWGAVVGTPGQRGDSGARRWFAGASPGRGSRRPKWARESATRRGEAREHA